MNDNSGMFASPSIASSGRKNRQFGINVGSSSILLIFVILCLISFATLSMVTANADRKLSEKILDRTLAYYEACNQAEAALADTDRTLAAVYASAESEEAYFSTVGRSKSYAIPISGLQSLDIQIAINYPRQEGETFYTITRWRVITTGELEYQSTLPVPRQ